MPFDGATLISSAEDALAAACAASGVARIDYDTLERHKAAQVLLHPPSWGYLHRGAVVLAQAAALAAGVFGFMLLASGGEAPVGLVLLLATLCVALLPMMAPARGRARWIERDASTLDGVHPEIRDRATRLQSRLPEVEFRIGELFQERVVLDPYLVADHRGATAILGIWEGDRVIA